MMELMSGLDVTSLFAMTVVVGLVAMAATRRTRNSNRWTVGSVDTSRAAVQQWSTAAPMSLDSADMHNGVTAATPVRQVVSAKDDSNGDGFRATKEFLKHGTRRGSGGLDMSQTSLMSNESEPKRCYNSFTTSWTIETVTPDCTDISPRPNAHIPPCFAVAEPRRSMAMV